jgi:hypothetical protein
MSGSDRQRTKYQALFDIDPNTGLSVEVFMPTERSKRSAETALVGSGKCAGLGARAGVQRSGHFRRGIRPIVMQ